MQCLENTRKRHPNSDEEAFYDIEEDWSLIEASFLKQYGLRLRYEDDMTWPEFCSLLSGIMEDTPLGRIVSIRAEKDIEKINHFTPEQKRIRNEWLTRHSNGLNTLAKMQGFFRDMCR